MSLTSCSRPPSQAHSAGENATLSARPIALRMSHYQFDPDTIPVKPGERIVLLLKSEDGLHNLQVERLGVPVTTLDTGGERRLEITIPEDAAGTEIPFVCTVDNHRDLGMRGVFTVAPNR